MKGLKGKLIYDHPNNLIHNFRGIFHSKESTENNENSLYLNNQQILLRVLIHLYLWYNLFKGTILKNTEWIIGLTIYTGHDSKIMKNQG